MAASVVKAKNMLRMTVTALCVWGLGACAFALTLGPTIIRECPGCHEELSQYTIGSGNTFGAKFWTDRKMEARMLPDLPKLVRCPKCSVLFWVSDAKELGRSELAFVRGPNWDKKWDAAPSLERPTEADLLSYAESHKLTEGREIYVRQRTWWLANDPFRRPASTSQKQTWSAAQRQNLMALSELLDETDPHERHLKAEIARELGQFDECEKLLEGKLDGERRRTAEVIRELSQQKNALVRELPRK
jgi:hypothetical protein